MVARKVMKKDSALVVLTVDLKEMIKAVYLVDLSVQFEVFVRVENLVAQMAQ